jgi:hypothetical protein
VARSRVELFELDHALDVLTPEDFASAASGFRYLQLSDVAELVEQAQPRYSRAQTASPRPRTQIASPTPHRTGHLTFPTSPCPFSTRSQARSTRPA